MNLSKTSEYAIRILCLMEIEDSELYTAKYMIERLKISDKYLRRIMTSLTKAGLIKSMQGRDGGYQFAKSAEQIFLLDIISAVDKTNKYTGCVLGFAECSDENPCAIHHEWVKARKPIIDMFTSTSLHDIVIRNIIVKH